jgi:flagellar hook-basal body complex protein FliE
MMKEEILKRAMFSMPLSKAARNSGIMEGFEDEEIEDLENQNYEDMPPMARSPQNPEILMNTLRGDMRSVDARYMELAQMVGEEAAYETPPEVLAMLQPQLAQQQQGGIGALPQAANMMPPGMMPPEMAPQGMPPEGGIAPFSQGGAEQAPPTPDGLPPARAAVGGLQTVASRFGQMVGDKAGTAAQALNAYLGRALMAPQPTLQRMTADGFPLSVQAREALMAGPGGTIVQGAGTRMAPYTTMGPLQSPTLTQGITTGLQQIAANNPRIAELVSKYGPGSVAALLGVEGARQYLTGVSPEDQKLEEFRQRQGYGFAPIPTEAEPAGPVGSMAERRATLSALVPRAVEGAPLPEKTEPLSMPEAPAEVATVDFLKKALASEGKKALSKGERIKAGYEEILPLYKELLGEDKESAKVNALLLLADAGLKFAGSRQRSVGMALAEAASGLPKGFAAIAAQAKEQEGKIKAAALSQAINDVSDQDKFAQAMQLEVLKGDFRVLTEQIKKMGSGSVISEDGGMGLRIGKTKDGGFLGTAIDPNDPTVKTAVGSRFTLRDTDNPFVENRGQAPTTVETDKSERVKLGSTLRSLDNSLSALDNLKGQFSQLYSPGTWFQDKVNNILVPVSGGLIRPDVDQQAAATQVRTGLNSITKSIASANDGGRVAVQEQEWARQLADAVADPTKFLANKELAAKTFNAMETSLRNARQQTLSQLGYVTNDYVMRTPNTGTQSDPFMIPTDPDQQKIMFTFLGSTIGKLQDPRAQVYIRMPNGTVSPFSPTQLRGLIGTQ